MTTFADLLKQLGDIQAQVDGAVPGSVQSLDLQILAKQIEREINNFGFDPLADIPSVAVPGFTHLHELGVELKKAIADEKKRNELLGKILKTAKGVAGLAGVPIP